MNTLKPEIDRHINEALAELVEDRHHLHMNPEVGNHLPDTNAYIKKRLKEMGIDASTCGDSGVVATIGKNEGKVLLLRADMDALPIAEETELPFKSIRDGAHACGHDFHMAMLLGTAYVLNKMSDKLNGKVKLMFQPGEEIGAGAKDMIAGGVLDDPIVNAAMALHVSPAVLPGEAIFYRGPAVTSSFDVFFFKFHGKGGHSSAPQQCIDPLLMVNTLYMHLSSLTAKEVSPSETAILSIGKMGGGTKVNIIPDTADLRCGLRCYNNDTREYLCQRIECLANSVATMYGGKCELELRSGTPSVVNDRNLLEKFLPVLEDVFGDGLKEASEPMSASEDFSHVSAAVPSVYIQIGAKTIGNDFPLHNPNVVLSDDVIPYGIRAFTECAFEYLK